MRPDGVLPVELPDVVREALLAPLVDQSCHGVRRDDLTRARFETLLSETGVPAPPGTTHFDTPAGAAVRRWCAPVLDLPPHVPPAVYLARRAELGAAEVNRRLLGAAGIATFLFDDSAAPGGPEVLPPAEMGRTGGAGTVAVARIERAEEEVAASAVSAVAYVSALAQDLAARAACAVALKSVTAHRAGAHPDEARPSRGTVIAAAARRLARPGERLTDPVLLRHLLWTAVDVAREYGRPLQFHAGPTGSGTGFVVAVQPMGVPVVLLRCHPFHRRAAHLASTLPHVYVDVGAAPARGATGSATVMAELLESVPFHRQVFGSGGHGVAETCHLGALHYRRGLAGALAARLADGEWSVADAARVAQMIGSGNARRLYRL
ncbi:amidohydrolase family protein [Streptosporangium sp. NPDC050855]|uniref:amidohydrolase family protein n=1 Tax=Streptosporangium sp. NPDC050855 TaxID=3366194 RepID=UPI0037B4086F